MFQSNDVYAPLTKKELRGYKDAPPKIYKNVDLDYVYIEFEQELHTWLEGKHVVAKVKSTRNEVVGSLVRDINYKTHTIYTHFVVNFNNSFLFCEFAFRWKSSWNCQWEL